ETANPQVPGYLAPFLIADGDFVEERRKVSRYLRVSRLIGPARVDVLILFAHLKQPTRSTVRPARVSVSTSIGIVVVWIELSYRLARVLTWTAVVLQH